ncbi:MAG: DUF3578 domain-containing protein [Rhodobacteraceae bacterium]|nr:DUF3578 domain-containing protein [Paracoccaceae bacterium]
MRDVFDYVSVNYLRARGEVFADHPVANYLRHGATDRIGEALRSHNQHLLVTGSAGQSRWAFVPWIAVFDPVVTTSAQRGHYIVLLFSADMTRVYLSLNQGTTAARDEFGSRANSELARRAELIRNRVPEFAERFSADPIHLGVTGTLPSGYEAGHAFGMSYALDELPFDIDPEGDLRTMVQLYFTATARGGTEHFGESSTGEPEQTPDDLVEPRRYAFHRRIERNAQIANKVKQVQGHECRACGFDFEAQFGALGKGYVEAHHLTPLSELPEDTAVSLDPETDFAVLCANCHRMIHRRDARRDLEEFRKYVRLRYPWQA